MTARFHIPPAKLGKPEWRDLLAYVADLHVRATRPAEPPLPYDWEEIGPGYCYGPAFGHWDIAHQCLDSVIDAPEHVRLQMLNNFANQTLDGLIPGSIWMQSAPYLDTLERRIHWRTAVMHPPVWPVVVDQYFAQTGDRDFLAIALDRLERVIAWLEANRRTEAGGFYYADVRTHEWESGVDESARFDTIRHTDNACVDASSHAYLCYEAAARWCGTLGRDGSALAAKAEALKTFIQQHLFCEETGFFLDQWSVADPSIRCLSHEGLWPLAVGVATPDQARRSVEENLLNPDRFFTEHPVASLAKCDPNYEMRMWRGPTWNSTTYWAAVGCLNYGMPDQAASLLDRALSQSARVFARTNTIWEFYHPEGGEPEDVARKPQTETNIPCPDYLGHNPLIAMARLWDQAVA